MPLSDIPESGAATFSHCSRLPRRLEYATRQAIICALTAFVVQLYQTPEPALTIYAVFFLNRADRTTSVVVNIVMLLLISVVIGLVLLTTTLVIDEPMWRVACMAVLSFALLFLTAASKLRPIGAIIALIVGYALDLLGTSPGGEIAVRGFLYAWLFIAIPAGLSIIVNLLVAPSPRRLLEKALAQRLRVCAAVLKAPDTGTRKALADDVAEGSATLMMWLKLAGAEKTSSSGDLSALRQGIEATIAIQLLIALSVDNPVASLTAPARNALARTLEEMAAILRSGGYPVGVEVLDIDKARSFSFVSSALLDDLCEALEHFAVAPPPALIAESKSPRSFFVPDAFSNPEHVQYALKTTGAAFFCYFLYVMLDWPGIHTCFITCYIVALSTTAEVVQKSTLRIVGCLVGASFGLAALVDLVPSLTSIGALMSIVFVGAFVAAWVVGGGPRIAYAGFQIAFAFFLCVIQGPTPAFDMATARDRVIGILIGNAVAYVVFVYVWPVSIARRIDPGIGAMLRGMALLARTVDATRRPALMAQTQSALRLLRSQIGLLAYEPRLARESQSWRSKRWGALQGLAGIIAPLLLAADRDTSVSEAVGGRLEQLAQMVAPGSSSPSIGPDQLFQCSDGGPNPMWGLVDDSVRTLESAVAQMAAPHQVDHDVCA